MRSAFFLLAWLILTGATYYVDPTGNDTTGDGSIGNPFLTIQKGVDTAVNPGDIVSVNDGTYTVGFSAIVSSGTAGNPITIKATNRGGAIIDTAKTVTGWDNTSLAANTYESSASEIGTAGNPYLWKTGSTQMLRYEALGPTAVVDEGDYWYDSGTDKFLIYTASDPTASVYRAWRTGNNSLAAIRVSNVSYVVIDGFVAQYGHVPLQIGSASSCAHGGTDHVTAQYVTAQYGGVWGIGVTTDDQCPNSYSVIDNSTIRYVSEINLSSSSNGHCVKYTANANNDNGSQAILSNSTIHDCRQHGIQFSNGWREGEFYNNRVYGYGVRGSGSGAGIRCGANPTGYEKLCSIHDNDIGNGTGGTGYSIGTGIYIQDLVSGVDVYNNLLHDNDWHGIYIFSVTASRPSDILIYNNLIYRNKTAGIRDEDTVNVEIANNTFFNNGEASTYGTGAAISLNGSPADGVTLRNNIFSTTTASNIHAVTGATIATSDYNLFHQTTPGTLVGYGGSTYASLAAWKATGFDAHSVSGDPLFTSTVTPTLTTTSSSPTWNAGTPLNTTFTTDYTDAVRGDSWDMGAYELSSDGGAPPPPEPGVLGTTISGMRIDGMTIR